MKLLCFFQGSIEKEQAGCEEFKEAKDELKKKRKSIFIQFQFQKKKCKEFYMVTPQKRKSDPLYQPAV